MRTEREVDDHIFRVDEREEDMHLAAGRKLLIPRVSLSSRAVCRQWPRLMSAATDVQWHADCTGRLVPCPSEHMESFNAVLSNAITGNEAYERTQLELVNNGFGGVPLLSLALIDSLRQGGRERSVTRDELRVKLLNTHIGPEFIRERYLAAAAVHWDRSDFLTAAVLLEQLLIHVGNDILSSRLAQEAYILAGHSQHSLGCLIRHPASFNAMPPFDATLIAMTSQGYLENHRHSEAEESAKRAVDMSGGADILPLCSLLDCYYLTGKSSDMIEVLDKHEPQHPFGVAKCLLRCRKSAAKIMRGNCNGGFKALIDIFQKPNPQVATAELTAAQLPLPVLCESALMLWLIVMNIDSRHVMALDEVIVGLTQALNSLDDSEPMKPIIQAIVLGSHLHALQSLNMAEYMAARKSEIEAEWKANKEKKSSNSMWSSLFGKSSSEKGVSEEKSIAETEPSSPLTASVREDNAKRIEAVRAELLAFVVKLNASESSAVSAQPMSTQPPDWMQIKSELPFLADASDSKSDTRRSTRAKALKTVAKAMAQFALQDYADAVQSLSPLHCNDYRDTGMSAMQRDVLWQTIIEAMMRDRQYDSASMLLAERTVLVPNDGQTWRRLAIIHRAHGQQALAEEAQYTAWQLGIGQGGFGGAI